MRDHPDGYARMEPYSIRIMKQSRIQVLIGFFLTISIVVVFRVIMPTPVDPELHDAETAYQLDKYDLKRRNLDRTSALTFWGIVSVLSTACLAILVVSSGWHRARVKRANVHLYKFDGSEVWVHERDLSMAWQVCTGLVNAKALEQTNQGMQKAFELYTTMADIQNTQLRALVSKRHLPALSAAPVADVPALPEAQQPVPSFSHLVQSGIIAPEKPMVFGYAHGQPKTGTWNDIYSNATGGQSGSGKTNTLRSLIVQSALHGVHFWVIDYHWPHEESLLYSLGELRETPYIEYADKQIDVRPMLEDVDATIERRLQKEEPCTQVKVLVIDEVLRIIKNCACAEDVIERIGTEGRKVNVLGLFSAQSWTADKISTTARDNLTSIFAHAMKRNKAQALLQDAEQARVVQKLNRGQMLFCPANGSDDVIDVPYCSEQDVKMVANMVGYAVSNSGNGPGNVSGNAGHVSGNAGHVSALGNALETPQETGKVSPVSRLRFLAKKPGFSPSKTARDIGMNKGYLYNILKGKSPSHSASVKIETWLRTQNAPGEVIQFPKKH